MLTRILIAIGLIVLFLANTYVFEAFNILSFNRGIIDVLRYAFYGSWALTSGLLITKQRPIVVVTPYALGIVLIAIVSRSPIKFGYIVMSVAIAILVFAASKWAAARR